MSGPDEVIHHGKFLTFAQTAKGWEYVTRANAKGCVAILAMTADRRVILTEQYRMHPHIMDTVNHFYPDAQNKGILKEGAGAGMFVRRMAMQSQPL